MSDRPSGFHLVGSISVPTVEEAFATAVERLPGRVVRIPDGEPKERGIFVQFQIPKVPSKYHFPGLDPTTEESPSVEQAQQDLAGYESNYDDLAIDSYNTFCKLRKEGKIPPNIRFQACVPTPVNITTIVAPEYRGVLDPIAEKALIKAVKNIQSSIPAEDLAIQFDCALDFALLEYHESLESQARFKDGPLKPISASHWVSGSLFDHLVRSAVAVASAVTDPQIEMGFHFCYGDLGGVHFTEPKDTERIVNYAKSILDLLPETRKTNWIHLPVPKDRDDEAYFLPLKPLLEDPRFLKDKTKLYLGLVHAHDEDGTKRRVKTAQKVLGSITNKPADFGVSSECGFGRTSHEDMLDAMRIGVEVTRAPN